MPDVHTYHTAVNWKEERKGLLSSENLPSLEVATPVQFPGGHAGIWSPEHLFVASAEVCLMTTFLSLAEKARLEFIGYRSKAMGTLEKTEAGFWMTQIVITPTVVISEESKKEKALNLLEKAEKYCLISNSMKTEVRIEPIIEVQG
jgi:peroxiredoxin-like protein